MVTKVLLKEIGDTGVEAPELAQGTWQYRGGPEALRLGIERGACFIDTAEGYRNEALVGEAIKGIRDRVFLASKVSPRHFRYNDVIKAAECSLKRLGTDYLDLYQLHWPNYTIALSETMSAMEKLVQDGKVRFIGVSNFSAAELARAQAQLSKTRIISNQIRYNLLDRSAEAEMLPYCERQRITLLAYSPLATGLDDLLRADTEDAIGQVARSLGKTRAQVALNWCVSQPAVAAIFKAEKTEHVEENCGASDWRLAPDQRRFISERVTPNRNRNGVERLARRILRRVLQHTGRDLGNPESLQRY